MAAVVLTLLAFILGLILLVLALRGRLINNHSLCRRCRFDLFGLTLPTRCPECGRDIASAADTRPGLRKRSAPMLTIGALLMLLSLAAATTIAVTRTRGVNWHTKMPEWMLVALADGWMGSATPELLEELKSRHQNSKLEPITGRLLAQRAFAAQQDERRTWLHAWGYFATLEGEAALSDEQFKQFVSRAFTSEFVARSRARSGGEFTIGWNVRALRHPTFGHVWLEMTGVRAWIEQAGQAVELDADSSQPFLSYSGNDPALAPGLVGRGQWMYGGHATRQVLLPTLDTGASVLRIRATQTLYLTSSAVGHDAPAPTNMAARVFSRTYEHAFPIQIVGTNESVVSVIPDPPGASALLLAAELRFHRIERPLPQQRAEPEVEIVAEFNCRQLDDLLVLRPVVIAIDGSPIPPVPLEPIRIYAGSLAANLMSGPTTSHTYGPELRHLVGRTVDVEMIPDPIAAETAANYVTIAGVRLLFRDVPIESGPSGKNGQGTKPTEVTPTDTPYRPPP